MARQENASYEGQGQRSSKQVTALDIYPVGAIFLTMDARNPAEYFGGKWELLAPGRTLVCVDVDQEDFNVPEKAGGAKSNSYTHTHATQNHALTGNEIPSHTHGFGYAAMVTSQSEVPGVYDTPSSNRGFQSASSTWFSGWYKGIVWETQGYGSGWGHNHGDVIHTAQSISTLQPYMTCYMWKRTA